MPRTRRSMPPTNSTNSGNSDQMSDPELALRSARRERQLTQKGRHDESPGDHFNLQVTCEDVRDLDSCPSDSAIMTPPVSEVSLEGGGPTPVEQNERGDIEMLTEERPIRGATTLPAAPDNPEDAATSSNPSFEAIQAFSQADEADWQALFSAYKPSNITAGTDGLNLLPNAEMPSLPGMGDFMQGMDTVFAGDSYAGPLTQPELAGELSTSASDLADKVRSLEAKNERLESMVDTQGWDMAAMRSGMGQLIDQMNQLRSILGNTIQSNGSQVALLSSIAERIVNPDYPARLRHRQQTLTSSAGDQ